LKLTEEKKIYNSEKLVTREAKLQELLVKCNERLNIDLDNDLGIMESKISFLENERKKYETQLSQMEAAGKTSGDDYEQVKVSVTNKKQELVEAQEKLATMKRLVENQKKLQSSDQ